MKSEKTIKDWNYVILRFSVEKECYQTLTCKRIGFYRNVLHGQILVENITWRGGGFWITWKIKEKIRLNQFVPCKFILWKIMLSYTDEDGKHERKWEYSLIIKSEDYLSILFLTKGGISEVELGAKNWRVSPRSGQPIEPGGSFPLHLGFLQRYTQYVKFTTPKIAIKIPSGHILVQIYKTEVVCW